MCWGLVEGIRMCLGKCCARVGAPPRGGPSAGAPASLTEGLAHAEGKPSGACPPVRELQGPLASAGCLGVDAEVGWLAEARLELGPPEVWPGGSFWPSSPLFLTSSFQKRGTVLRTQRQEVGMQLQLPSLRPPLLSGPCVLVGDGASQDACGRGLSFLAFPTVACEGVMVTNTDQGWNLSVRAGGVSCTDGPTMVDRGLDLATALPSKDRRGAGRGAHMQRLCLPVTLSRLHKYFMNGRKENVPKPQSQHVFSGHP